MSTNRKLVHSNHSVEPVTHQLQIGRHSQGAMSSAGLKVSRHQENASKSSEVAQLLKLSDRMQASASRDLFNGSGSHPTAQLIRMKRWYGSFYKSNGPMYEIRQDVDAAIASGSTTSMQNELDDLRESIRSRTEDQRVHSHDAGSVTYENHQWRLDQERNLERDLERALARRP